ncbi:52 kDa repressor of the inhibitor of the protein kinase-like [Musca domestica]|uniref:52 kDa repressor of the inhibitor of the protein kinase-like n=1 Tax=Musca domestica TaxID=7370 RepID=A0ABM3VJB4_MUSDO|nr:52 kDa repressor of the inhibitor of the protein kinase-like [Musca domestica]
MAGNYNGVQAIIKTKYPSAIYIHCSSHILNLSLNAASKLPDIRNIFSIISEICTFFRRSPKRSGVLSKMFTEGNKPSKRLPNFCETRWVERHDSVQIFNESLEEIIQSLEELGEKGCSDALSFHHRIVKFDFLLGVAVTSRLLELTLHLSQYLQTVNLDIVQAYDHIHLVVGKLKTIRENADEEFHKIYLETRIIAEKFGVEVSVPRRVGTQKYRSNVACSDSESYYRITLFAPYLDELIANMTSRFLENESVVKTLSNIVPSRVVSCSYNDFQDMMNFYEKDLRNCKREVLSELELWITMWKRKTSRTSNPLEAIVDCDENLQKGVFQHYVE